MRTTAQSVFAFVALLGACSYTPAPVPVDAAPADFTQLVGEWSGSYEMDGHGGRSGSILFRLNAGEDHAHGDVLMVMNGTNMPDHDVGKDVQPAPPAEDDYNRLLPISFVQAANGIVTGVLEPYKDPSCGGTVRTTFTGQLDGDVIEGVFTSVHIEHDHVVTGTWTVKRHRQ